MSSRNLKIAGVAALAGTMMAVAIIGVTTRDRPAPATMSIKPAATAPDPLARELDRCATLTMPDAGCEAAWAANRSRFFGQGDHPDDATNADRPPADRATTNTQSAPEQMAPLPATEGARP